MPVATITTSAAGSLTLLEDEDQDVRVYALQHLLTIVPQFWAEISDKLSYLELLADPISKELPPDSQPYAALLVSKVYFYVGELSEAVEFALRAGHAFEKEQQEEYKETIISGCLDRAIAETSAGETSDPNLQIIVDSVLKNNSGENGKLAIGLAMSLRRLDLVEATFLASKAPASTSSTAAGSEHDESLLRYVLSEAVSGSSGNENWPESFRAALFSLLLKLFTQSSSPDWNAITIIWLQLDDHKACAEALFALMKEGKKGEAYQVAFDVYEFARQGFVEAVIERITAIEETDKLEGKEFQEVLVDGILRGETTTQIMLNFLYFNNKADMSSLTVTKDSLEDRYSIYHSAITFTNAYTNCGTLNDDFLRKNLPWLGRASNWAKFSATAGLGLISKGSWVNGFRSVKPYLPGGVAPNKFSEGGALFALGLMYAGHLNALQKREADVPLKQAIAEGNDPIVQHGAALGLGLAGLATADEGIYEDIRTALFQDDATAGEAAGYAMGLIMLGTASEKALDEMLSYARETQHEKIIRSLAVGVALLMYGQREKADPVIQRMMEEKDAILRYGGMFAVALAYAGTGNNQAVRKLLHFAVSDVNDDVRRAAVTALGFVLFRNHTQVPRVVQLLAESYNPHVRHGATLALGISCASTGLESAIELLEPMTRDPVDFVRQGAYISLALILLQQPDTHPKTLSTRELFAKVVADKHEDPMARFGASLAQGIIDAGGRNMTLSLSTRAGTLNLPAIVGMTLFVQFWYWFPLAHCLGLAFSPTTLIAVDESVHLPKVEFTCNARASSFAYPSAVKEVKEKEKAKAKTAVLSTTARAQARAKTKRQNEGDAMDTDQPETPSADAGKPLGAKSTDPVQRTSTPRAKKPEATSFKVANMTRVLPNQLQYISLPPDDRYVPVRPLPEALSQFTEKKGSKGASSQSRTWSTGSILVLRDNKPELATNSEDYLELAFRLWPYEVQLPPEYHTAAATTTQPANDSQPGPVDIGDEAEMPAPFEFPFED